MLPSFAWLVVASATGLLLRDRLPPALLSIFALRVALPAIFSLQKGWMRVLWADRLDRARNRAEQAPQDANAHYELAVLLQLRGEEAEALAGFERARAIVPGHPASTVSLGHLAADADDLPRALSLFEEAAERAPDLFSAWFGIASVQVQREQFARASAAYERALKIEPNDGFALAGLARCCFELGDHERARELSAQASRHGVADDDLVRDLRDADEE